MRVDELSKLTDEELRNRADTHFIAAEELHPENQDDFTYAQLYLSEIRYRHDERIAKRDFRLEIWVIVLIGLEIVLGVVGIAVSIVETRSGAKQTERQMEILGSLNTNFSKTTIALTALQAAQEQSLQTQQHTLENIITMNTALQDTMQLNYAVALTLEYDEQNTRLNFLNKGKTSLYLWGTRLDGNLKLQEEPRLLIANGGYSIEATTFKTEVSQKLPKGTDRLIPLDIYVRTTDQKWYTVKTYLAVRWEGDNLKIRPQLVTVSRGKW